MQQCSTAEAQASHAAEEVRPQGETAKDLQESAKSKRVQRPETSEDGAEERGG